MKTLRNAAILTALAATATALVIMPMDSSETTTVPGIVVTPQATTSASPREAATSASPREAATQTPGDRPEQAPGPAAPAPTEPPAAPALPPAPVAVPQDPGLGGVCEWDDEEWECDEDRGED